MSITHAFITYVADREATREVEQLSDYYGLGQLIVTGELKYESARDQLVAAFAERDLKSSTAKVYMSQGYALAQLFDTFADVEDHADEVCNGSRSLKRIYDSTRVKADAPVADATAEGETNAAETAPADLLSVILANLAHLTDAAQIAQVRDAAIAMLAPVAVAV